MALCSNFVDNVQHDGIEPIQDDVIANADIVQDMTTSDPTRHRYLSPTEISIGAGYSIKFENDIKNLYKDGTICDQSTLPEAVISNINQYRGGRATSMIGTTVSNNYGLHMGPDHAFQFYKRIQHPSSDDEDGATNTTTTLDKRYGYRCTNKAIGADKTCGNKVKSGNPINSAHNCPGKGYECTFPQGPEGNDYGICCYSISTAQSCGFEGGYCFLDKVKNTCGNDCIN
ncbi:hypothetical protein L228DRAFT_269016 [Xylona heveae TC161]|uniref:Uncharacterized protein n=1 Tax=Xylona heveae (strain CBS 132557 / TC161) TaxID=1328760 RepID=A0A165FYW0_XYLHT|nr:hypothetical protein L228DRAFT_269016 [Xylona heveae TC161]KZF21546.1 hypothetical protein L228DRAFT_269016 [Xylona heveae TC161]